VFVYQAGSQPIQLGMMTPGGVLPAATGSQPVTVSARAVANWWSVNLKSNPPNAHSADWISS
jgi:hypothetical protein